MDRSESPRRPETLETYRCLTIDGIILYVNISVYSGFVLAMHNVMFYLLTIRLQSINATDPRKSYQSLKEIKIPTLVY